MTPSIGQRFEAGFAAWAGWVVRYRWTVTLGTLALTGWFVSQLPDLKQDFSARGFLRAGDEVLEVYDAFQERYGSENPILVAINPPEVFDLEFLGRLRALHRDLESEVPYVEEVTSLVNARLTYGEDDQLIVEELMANWPEDEAGLEVVRSRAMGSPFYVDNYVSSDFRLAVVLVKPQTYTSSASVSDTDALAGFDEVAEDAGEPELLTQSEQRQIVSAIEAIADRYRAEGFDVYVVGTAVVDTRWNEIALSDAPLFGLIVVGIAVVLLIGLFGRVSFAAVPLLIVMSAALSTFGVMVLAGIGFSITMQILPAFLIAVGICDSVHILTIVSQRLEAGDTKEAAIVESLRHSGFPVLITSVTTAAGLLSFRLTEVAPVAQLGAIAPVGILFALFYSITLLPAVLALLPLKGRVKRGPSWVEATVARAMSGAATISTRYPGRVLAVTAAILAVSLPGVTDLRLGNNPLSWLSPDEPVRQAVEFVDEKLRGTQTVEILIDTQRENGLRDPEVLQRIDRAVGFAEGFEVGPVRSGKVVSIVDIVKEIHQALNENRAEYFALPTSKALLAQEILLFENSGSDDLEQFTDINYRYARISMRVSWADGIHYGPFLDGLSVGLEEILGEDLPFEVTGKTALLSRVFSVLLTSMARSYTFSLVVISFLMIFVLGSVSRGLLSMIPNLIPIVLIVAAMGWLDIPFNATTMLVGSIVIGLSVDDTIHFMHGFGRYYDEYQDSHAAVHETLRTTGAALLTTSVSLAGHFLVIAALGELLNIRHYGLLAGGATIAAFLTDIFVAPALMVLVSKDHARSSTANETRPAVDPVLGLVE